VGRAAARGLEPLCSPLCPKPPRGGRCALGAGAPAGIREGIPGSWRGDSIISCLQAGEFSLSLIYSHPRNAVFHHHSHAAETGRVLPPLIGIAPGAPIPPRACFHYPMGSADGWVPGGNKAADTLMLLLGEILTGAHENLLEHPEKDPNVSPAWVPGAAAGRLWCG